MQHAYSDFFLFFFFPSRLSYFSLSIYRSLSLTKEKKKQEKKRVYTHAKFLCIFLRNARPLPPPSTPPHPTRLHTQMVILSKLLIQASVPGGGGGGGGGGCLAPKWVPMLEQKGRRKATKQCVTPLNIEWFFPLGPEKPTLFYWSCIFHTLNDDSAAHCPALKKYPFT